MSKKIFATLALIALVVYPGWASSAQYIRIGNSQDAHTHPRPGTAMMGGGSDLDEAFLWLCGKGDGGDFLVLRAHGDDSYNSYVKGLCKLNSVATLIIPDRKAAEDPKVAEIINGAEVLFVAGGDQANYINFWKGTPVQRAINAHIASGKPIGGTSAGLAVQGEVVYGALNDPPDSELQSKDALTNPYTAQVALVRDFLNIPYLKNTITDSHFAKRDRMGRTLVFLARIMKDGWSERPRDVAIDEKSAFLVEDNGAGKVVGQGRGIYFLQPTASPVSCEKNVPLTFPRIAVYHVRAGGHFDLTSWKGDSGNSYFLSVKKGVIVSTQPGNGIY